MGRTVSVEQVDGMIADLARELDVIQTKIIALKDTRKLFFGDEPATIIPKDPPATVPGGGTVDEKRWHVCAECTFQFPRTRGPWPKICPRCQSPKWNKAPRVKG